jgi:hypothetical protein
MGEHRCTSYAYERDLAGRFGNPNNSPTEECPATASIRRYGRQTGESSRAQIEPQSEGIC